jgi:peroxiredoxin
MIGKQAPLVELYSIDGIQFNLDEYQGKPLVVLFWAQWCRRSKSFVQDLRDAAPVLKSRGISILAVDIDKQENLTALKMMFRDFKLEAFDHAFSGNDVYDQAFNAFRCGEVPTVFILDSAHRIIAEGNSFDVVAEHYRLE